MTGHDPMVGPTEVPVDHTVAPEGRPSRCTACKGKILWFRTPAGRDVPVDVDVVECDYVGDGESVNVWLAGGCYTRLRRTPGALVKGRTDHRATCPNRPREDR